jgi:hypothetical protein
MQNTINKFRILGAVILIILLQSFSGCNETTPPDEPVVKEPITIIVNNLYNGAELTYHQLYKSPQDNDLWITQSKYYLSNVVAVRANGTKELIADIAIIDQTLGTDGLTFSGNVTKGDYVGIKFDLGVREDLNLKDPATYGIEHPLSVTQNMYWGWSTQYIFSKLEGFEVANNDTSSFVIHTGLQDLYRPNVNVSRAFTVETGGTSVSVNFDIFSLLKQTDYTFNLIDDGESHTTDNMQLAIQYMDNFTTAFN